MFEDLSSYLLALSGYSPFKQRNLHLKQKGSNIARVEYLFSPDIPFRRPGLNLYIRDDIR